jgi:HEAT repeat protein
VVGVPRLKSAKEVRAALAGAQGSDYDQGIAALAELSPQEAESLAAQDAAMLRRLTVDRLPQVRIAAVRALGKARNLDYVPTLIDALGDPDLAVVREAHDALRRISRRLSAADLPQQPTDAQRRAVVEEWRKWHLAVRPEAEL